MKEISHSYHPEVLVVGGGSAGCAAALAAAERGVNVLLVEEENCLGGTSTAGGVNEFYANFEGMGDIFRQVLSELKKYHALKGRFFNGEYLKLILQRLMDEAGVKVMLRTSILDAEVEENWVRKVRGASASHIWEFAAPFMIDASGEGDLAFLAGMPFQLGHPESGLTLHMSLTALFYNTGEERKAYLPPGYEPIETEDDLPGLHGPVRLPDNRLYANMTKVMGCNPTDPLSLSQAEQEARRQLIRITHYVQTRYPMYALISSGQKIGIREGRRIIGEKQIRQDLILGNRPHLEEDGIAVATAQIDFHSLSRPGHVGWRQKVHPYAIPLGALIPKGAKNMLVAGKPISGDQVSLSSYRMIPTVYAIGQAAGTAAALAVSEGLDDIRQLDIIQLQNQLNKDGIELDPCNHQFFSVESTPDPEDAL